MKLGNYFILFTDKKNLEKTSIKVWSTLAETIFMNSEKSKTSEPHRFSLDLTDKLFLEAPKKNMTLTN